jgi:amidohydrolase
LGLIRTLIETHWQDRGKGEIYFIFQPAEEKGAGAKVMLESGFFDKKPIDAIFAVHLDPRFPTGAVELLEGPAHAASDTLEIEISGKSGHGALPHLCHDPIVAAAYFITALQTLVARSLDPMHSAVITIGEIHSGTATNIIPDQSILKGTLRTLFAEDRLYLLERIQALLTGLEISHQVKCRLRVHDGYPVLVNHSVLTAHMQLMAEKVLGDQHIIKGIPRMGAEDFAYFCQRWPGVMVAVGCHDPVKGYQHGLHSPFFQMDENALMVAVRLFSHTLASYSNYFSERKEI